MLGHQMCDKLSALFDDKRLIKSFHNRLRQVFRVPSHLTDRAGPPAVYIAIQFNANHFIRSKESILDALL